MIKIRILLLLIHVLLLVPTTPSHAKQPPEKKPLRLLLNWKPECEFGGFYAAQVEGLYKKRGLDVEIIPGGAGTPTVQMIATGKAEFGIASAEEILISRSHGTDLVALFAVYQTSPMILMSHSEHHFKSIKDIFQSKNTLAVRSGLPFYTYLVKKLGQPQATVVPHLGGIGNFLHDPNHSQQGFMTSEPLLAARKEVKASPFLISQEGFDPYLTVLIVRKSYMDENLPAVKTMVGAVRDGWKSFLKDPTKTNELMNQLNPSIDLQTLKESADTQKRFIFPTDVPTYGPAKTEKRELGQMTMSRWEILARQLQSIQLMGHLYNLQDVFRNF